MGDRVVLTVQLLFLSGAIVVLVPTCMTEEPVTIYRQVARLAVSTDVDQFHSDFKDPRDVYTLDFLPSSPNVFARSANSSVALARSIRVAIPY